MPRAIESQPNFGTGKQNYNEDADCFGSKYSDPMAVWTGVQECEDIPENIIDKGDYELFLRNF